MTEQNTPPADKPKASTAEAKNEPVWKDPKPKEVTVQKDDGPKVKVTKPGTEYTQLVNGYGYKEI